MEIASLKNRWEVVKMTVPSINQESAIADVVTRDILFIMSRVEANHIVRAHNLYLGSSPEELPACRHCNASREKDVLTDHNQYCIYHNDNIAKNKSLPLPRLQFRWFSTTHPGYLWECRYELIMSLQPGDIRNTVDHQGNHRNYGALLLGTTMSKSQNEPTHQPSGDYLNATSDHQHLGLPVYLILPNGITEKILDKDPTQNSLP